MILLLLIGILIIIWLERNDNRNSHIHTLIRQTARWAIASEQDKNPLIAVLHANYAVGYLSALKEIATDKEIEKITGLDIIQFQRNIQTIQDKATMNATNQCPSFAPQSPMSKIAGNR